MVNGILFFQQGGLQQIGELASLENIITTIEKVLPGLKQQELDRLLKNIPREVLEAALSAKAQDGENVNILSV